MSRRSIDTKNSYRVSKDLGLSAQKKIFDSSNLLRIELYKNLKNATSADNAKRLAIMTPSGRKRSAADFFGKFRVIRC